MTGFVNIWTSKSGEIFGSFLGAKEEDATHDLAVWLSKNTLLVDTWMLDDPFEDVIAAILKNRNSLAQILNDLVKYAK